MRAWVHTDTFQMGTDKDRAKKVTEEAAEAFSAWEAYADPATHSESQAYAMMGTRNHVVYECCDTIQAALNLLAGLGVTQGELDAAMESVRLSNEERGRYR